MIDSLQKTRSNHWPWFLLAALLLGTALRLAFPGDIEYKEDEQYMFQATRTIGVTEPLPMLGMKSGVKIKNPGMSLWVFAALSKLSGASNPPELARAVQALNILALALLVFFVLRLVPETERLPWLWATALVAVNPFAVLFARKIWAQCTLPFFCVLFWMAWHYRKERGGAFFWGLLGICLGQIHLSGFFLTAGVFLWTLYREKKVRWGSWLAGSVLGGLPLIPWIQSVLTAPPVGGPSKISLLWILYPKFWFYWVTDPLGVFLTYSLKTRHFFDFLRYPLVGEQGTYLVGLLHLALLGIGIKFGWGWAQRKRSAPSAPDRSETALALNGALIGMGILLTLSCAEVFRHYLIVTFPLEFVWLARLALRYTKNGHRYLMALWFAELLLSAAFLGYLHVNHGDPLGDYGTGYQWQGANP